MHLSRLFSLCPKLLSKTTSFLLVSASLVHLVCLWGPERVGRAPSEQNYTKPPALQRCVEEVILFTSKQTRSYVSLLSLPDEQTNIQSKPCNKKVQIFLPLLHHKSLFISRNVKILILIDIDFTVFSFTECFLLPM